MSTVAQFQQLCVFLVKMREDVMTCSMRDLEIGQLFL